MPVLVKRLEKRPRQSLGAKRTTGTNRKFTRQPTAVTHLLLLPVIRWPCLSLGDVVWVVRGDPGVDVGHTKEICERVAGGWADASNVSRNILDRWRGTYYCPTMWSQV